MEYRQLGRSGLRISKLTMGTMTFGGRDKFRDVGADRSRGRSAADRHGARCRREPDRHGRRVLRGGRRGDRRSGVARRARPGARGDQGAVPDGPGSERRRPVAPPSDRGLRGEPAPPARPTTSTSTRSTSGTGRRRSRRRSGRSSTSCESGKVRYVGCSNFAGWQVMKALGIADRTGLPRFVSQQVYLSLQERRAEYEIVPSAIDQGLGLLIWSPLAGGLLSGKYRRGQAAPAGVAPRERVDRAADLRRGQALRHDRGARRDRRGARRVAGAGRAGVAARATRASRA